MDNIDFLNPIERRLVNKANRNYVPITANFEITPYCNLHCDMCYVRMGRKEIEHNGGLLPLETWLRIAQEFKQLGTLFILLTGGEPLLYPNFIELYLQLRSMGFIICINTNGTLITEDIALLFHKYKPRRVNVTLYGATNETYHHLCHVQNGYDRCIRGLNLLRKFGVDYRINLTLLKSNQSDYDLLLKVADSLRCCSFDNFYTSVFCRQNCTSQKDISQLRMTPKDVARLELDYLKREKGEDEFQEYLRVSNYLLNKNEELASEGIGLSCRAGKSSCWINWQGEVTPCVDMVSPQVSLLSHTASEAWEMIVNRSTMMPKHDECRGCNLRSICNVCYANATNEKKYCGSLDYLCAISKEKQKLINNLLSEHGMNA